MTVEIGLVGSSIAHSLSPAIHQAAFDALGMDWRYRLEPVPVGELAAHWPRLASDFRGVNVTAPHKVAAAALVERLAESARMAGSVNTVLFDPSGAVGESTDGAGFMAALARSGSGRVRRAVVLGTGGAARAIGAAMASSGVDVAVVGRNLKAGGQLVAELSSSCRRDLHFAAPSSPEAGQLVAAADLVANATPLGGPGWLDCNPLGWAGSLSANLVIFDLIYRPRRTLLLREAQAAGCATIEGVEMLVAQAALSFELWSGIQAPLSAMRSAAEGQLSSIEGRQ